MKQNTARSAGLKWTVIIADKFFECSTNRVFKIIPKVEGDEK